MKKLSFLAIEQIQNYLIDNFKKADCSDCGRRETNLCEKCTKPEKMSRWSLSKEAALYHAEKIVTFMRG